MMIGDPAKFDMRSLRSRIEQIEIRTGVTTTNPFSSKTDGSHGGTLPWQSRWQFLVANQEL